MIDLTIFKNLEDENIGIRLSGHSNYAEYGSDIICSAVSSLSINLVNSVEKFTNDKFELEIDDGYLYFLIKNKISKSSKLLLSSCILGLEEIQKQYGNQYINIKFQEVK